MTDDQWQDYIKGVLKAEIKRRNLNYVDLADKLAAIGVTENSRNLSNKIERGRFSAEFLAKVLIAIGCDHFSLHRPLFVVDDQRR